VGESLGCAGVPRDLGVAQGRAQAAAIRARVGRPCRWRRAPRALARLDRDLWRHHPQVAERLEGLALGARVPRRALLEALAGEAGMGAGAPQGGIALALAGGPDGGPLVAKLVGCGQTGLVLRRSRPEAGIAALEATLAWLPSALAGVNEAGLAVAVSAAVAPPDPGEPCGVPALVLVQDCLQRFSSAEAALDWCLKRPAGGATVILAADAQGRVLGAALAAGRRRALAPEDGVLVGSGPEPERAALAKACREAPARDPSALAAALAAASPGAIALCLDPTRRRLTLATWDTAPTSHSL